MLLMSLARLLDRLLLISVLLIFGVRHEVSFADILDPLSAFQPCQHKNPLMNATHETFRGVNLVWQIPENPRAILFFASALNKKPFQYFDLGPSCMLCCSFPEERLATLAALENGYAVVVLQSIESGWNVWPLESPDIDNVVTLLEAWPKRHNLEDLPIVAWGQSIGGALAVSLGVLYRLPLRAIVVMTALELSDQFALVNPSFPPTMFVYFGGNPYQEGLPTDEQTFEHMAALSKWGVPVARLRLEAEPVSPLYLTQRIHCMTDEWSTKLFEKMGEYNVKDANNYLTINPNDPSFATFVDSTDVLPLCQTRNEVCLEADVLNELKRAYGVHAFSSGGNSEIFSWLESMLGLERKGTDLRRVPSIESNLDVQR